MDTQFGNITSIVSTYKDRSVSSVFSGKLSEANVMTLLFSSSFSVDSDSITYLLKYNHRDVYVDFIQSVKFYDAEFNFYDSANPGAIKSIVNVDVSYFCSQEVIKYVFLLDLLSEIYAFKSKYEYVSDRITIRTRCRKVQGTWMVDNNKVYSFDIKFQYDQTAGLHKYIVADEVFADMCKLFEIDIIRHLNYLNKTDISSADSDYTKNIRVFYMFCRLKLMYYVLLCCSKINRTVGTFIGEKISYCFINIKNHIEVKNVNNRSIVLTNQLIDQTGKIKMMNNSILRNNDNIKKNASAQKMLKYDSARGLFYTSIAFVLIFSVIILTVNGLDQNIFNFGYASWVAIAFVIIVYLVFSLLINRNKQAIEQFSTQGNSGLDWTKHALLPTSLTRFPRRPLTNSSTVRQSNYYNMGAFPPHYAFDHETTGSNYYRGVGQHHSGGQYYSSGNAIYVRSFSGYRGDWIKINIGERFVMKKVRFFCRSGFTNRAPGKFRIYGTNDINLFNKNIWNSGWTLVHNQTSRLTGYVFNSPREVSISTDKAFSIYVLVVNQLSGNGTDCLNFVEWEMYGDPVIDNNRYPRKALTSGQTVKQSTKFSEELSAHLVFNQNFGDFMSAASGEYNASDGMGRNKHSFGAYYGDWIMINVDDPFVLNEVKLHSRNGYANSAPGMFRIYGTNDMTLFDTPDFSSANWNLIHDQTSRLTGYQYKTPKNVPVKNTETYLIYVLVVNQLSGNADTLTFNEWELYGTLPSFLQKEKYMIGASRGAGKIANVANVATSEHAVLDFTGFFYTNEFTGDFTFYINAGRESFISIKDDVVVYNHETNEDEKKGIIKLEAYTYYPIQAKLFNKKTVSMQFSHDSVSKRSDGTGFYYYFYKDGLEYVHRDGYLNYGKGRVLSSGVDTNIINRWNDHRKERFNVEYNGFFYTKNFSGNFSFWTTSDDDSLLYIWKNGIKTLVVNNGGLHPPQVRAGVIALEENTYYPIQIFYSENTGGNILSVHFAHASIPQTSNGLGHYFSIGYDKQWYEKLSATFDAAQQSQEAKTKEAEEAAKMAEEELKKKAALEKQSAEELEALKLKNEKLIEVIARRRDDSANALADANRKILEKEIEIKQSELDLARAETERARVFAEAEVQNALKEKQMLTEHQLKDDIESFRDISRDIDNFKKLDEKMNALYAEEIKIRQNALAQAESKKFSEEGKLLAAKITDMSNKLLIEREDSINRKSAAELAALKRSVEIARKEAEDAIKKSDNLNKLSVRLNSLDQQFAAAEAARLRAEHKKQEQILVTNEARIRAELAREVEAARKDHYKKIKEQLDSMIADQESNEEQIKDTEREIQRLDNIIKKTINDDLKAQEEARNKFDVLEAQRLKEIAELNLNILNLNNDIFKTRMDIEQQIRESIERRSIIIDINKRLTETAFNIFKQNFRLEQYRYVSNALSIDTSIEDISTRLSSNIDNTIMAIANSIVISSLAAEYRDMTELDEYTAISSHRTTQGVDITVRNTKLVSASTRLTMNLFALTMTIIIFGKKLSFGSKAFIFGIAYSVIVCWYIIQVAIIVRTKPSNKYWMKPMKKQISASM